VCALGLAATLFVALHTARGLYYDAVLFRHVSGTAVPLKTAGARLLYGIDVGSVAVATLLIAMFGLARRRLSRAVAAVAVVVLSVGTAELLKHGLPHLAGAIPSGRPLTIPSGHTSIAVSLGLALVLAAPPVLRPTAAVVGAAYAAGVALAVVILGWHYPSDVVASFFVCGFWAAVAAVVLDATPKRPDVSRAGAALAVVAVVVVLFGAALIAQRHPDAVEAARSARSVVAMGTLLSVLSLGLFGAFLLLAGERRR
jgi:membrane-associated phospholipid phosphatase